ncbi:MAG: GNAT family N-acetyltransferase [bacterium]
MPEGTVVFEGSYNGADIVVRHVRRNDIEQLLTFINTLSKEQTYIRVQGEQLTMDEENRYMDNFMYKVGLNRAIKLLVFHEGELIAVADIACQDKVESHVGVFGITVKKEWRGKGIGTLLMRKTIEEGVKHIEGLKIITLGVFGNNPIAKELYEKMGFKEYGLLPRGIRHKGEFVDHVWMYREVV